MTEANMYTCCGMFKCWWQRPTCMHGVAWQRLWVLTGPSSSFTTNNDPNTRSKTTSFKLLVGVVQILKHRPIIVALFYPQIWKIMCTSETRPWAVTYLDASFLRTLFHGTTGHQARLQKRGATNSPYPAVMSMNHITYHHGSQGCSSALHNLATL